MRYQGTSQKEGFAAKDFYDFFGIVFLSASREGFSVS
ncbi:unnamed protein product, partial [marine sediment metagenome]